MFRTILTAAAILTVATPVLAAPCRDAHGKFTKCPPAKSVPAAKCKDMKGRFAKCGTAGAKPIGGK
jgi:hypothetical protein